MAKPSGSKASRLAAEERMLEQQREEIMRRTQELEQKLKVLPTVIEAQEEQRRALAKRRAASAGRAISPYTLGGGGTTNKGARNPDAVAATLRSSGQNNGAADRAGHHLHASLARCSRELRRPVRRRTG